MTLKRFLAFVIDVFVAVLLFMPVCAIFILLRIELLEVMLAYLIWFIVFCKDCFNGRSVGKLLFNCQVIDETTGKAANPFKCIFRNLFYLLGLFDVIPMCFGAKKMRVADIVTKTDVLPCSHPLKIRDFLKGLLAIALMFVLFLIINCVLGNILPMEKLPLPQ